VQIDEVGTIGHQVRPRQSREDADHQQKRRRGGQSGRRSRRGRSSSRRVYSYDSNDRSPFAFATVTVE
jgi:hypothetical protein